MTKIKSWGLVLGNFTNKDILKLPDPYLIDDFGYNAFDSLSTLRFETTQQFKNDEINYSQYHNKLILLNYLSKRFLNDEIKRTTDPDFKPRFTEKLANEINQKENELLQKSK